MVDYGTVMLISVQICWIQTNRRTARQVTLKIELVCHSDYHFNKKGILITF